MKSHANIKVLVAVAMVGALTIHTNLHITSLVPLEKERETSGKIMGMDDVISTIDGSHTIKIQQRYENSSTGMIFDEKPQKTVKKVVGPSFTNDDRRHSIWKYPLPPGNPQNQQQQQVQEHQQHSRVIVLLSMGPSAAESTLVERCVISIRFRGRFMGPILLLTDASADRFAPLTKEDDQLVLMHPLLPDWNFALKRDLPYKRFKTYILSYLERDDRLQHVSLAYYLDFDLVVGQDLQLWFDHVESQYLSHRPTGSDGTTIESPSLQSFELVLFEGNVSPLQGGQFAVQKGRSEGCLKRWRTYMDADLDEHKDQVSLTKMWNDQPLQQKQQGNKKKSNNSDCTIHRMPQKPYLTFLSTKEMASLQGGGGNGTKTVVYPTLMHIKNTHHAQLIPGNIQREFYQNLLQLPPDLILNITAKRRIRPNRTWTEEQVKRGYS